MLQCDFAQISDFSQRFEQNPSPDRLGLGRELRCVESQAVPVAGGELAVSPIRQFVQPRPILTRQAGSAGDRHGGRAAIGRVELRDNPVPDSIAGIGHVGVGFVLDPRLAPGPEVVAKVIS